MSSVTPNPFQQSILTFLSGGVEDARKRFDAKTGRFLAANGGWAVTNQDIIYPLALLYATPGTKWHNDTSVLELIQRGGDALRDWQDDTGRVEFIKIDGSLWGKTYMCWSMYHWVEALGLMRNHLDQQRRQRWEEGLRLAYFGVLAELGENPRIHNIPAWHAMGMTRAGHYFGEQRLLDGGKRIIHKIAATQVEDGYWAEGGGPTTLYSLVYVHALGLYYFFTGDQSALPYLQRALEFHIHFTYPDGAQVETVDGRVRYHGGVATMGLPGFAPFERGRAFIRHQLDCLLKHSPAGGLNTHFADIFQHCPADAPKADLPQHQKLYTYIHRNHAMMRRQGPWYSCCSGYLTATDKLASNERNRWYLDRQNYLSIWHEKAGLVIGGGNSKGQCAFSTFEVVDGRVIRIQADTAQLEQSSERDTLRLTYGQTVCEVSVAALDDRRMEITFRATGPASDRIRAAFTLPHVAGKPLSRFGSDAAATPLDPLRSTELGWPAGDTKAERWVRIGQLRLDLPPESALDWPEYPFNPYAINNMSEANEAVAIVSTTLSPDGKAKTFLLTID